MHVNRVAVRTGSAGQCVTLALCGGVSLLRKQHLQGTVLLSPSATPSAAYEFDAEVREPTD